MLKKQATKKIKETKTLILMDHDGTLCDTNSNAYESLKYALKTASEIIRSDTDFSIIDWDRLFSELRGTTEKNLALKFCYLTGIPFEKMADFEQRFYLARSKWYENMKAYNEYIWDTYYPDAENLVYDYSKNPKYILMLVTGNPSQTMEQRLARHLRIHFENKDAKLNGVFGEEALSRAELIQKAITKAEKENPAFKAQKDSLGFYTNVVYIGDGRHDLFAGLNARVRVIWIPSRTLQITKDALSEDSIRYLHELLDGRIVVTNSLDSSEVKNAL